MNIKLTILKVFVVLALAGSVTANEITPYSDPLPIGDYIDDVNELLESAFKHDNWTLTPGADLNSFSGFISYRGFDITVGIVLQDRRLFMKLESVHATDCTSDCEDLGEKPVIQWLVNLRRTIAYELTFAVNEKLLSEIS